MGSWQGFVPDPSDILDSTVLAWQFFAHAVSNTVHLNILSKGNVSCDLARAGSNMLSGAHRPRVDPGLKVS